jgi:hypothetical protein
VYTSAVSDISTVYLRNIKETTLNNELSSEFPNIALNITPKSIFYAQCCFCQVDSTNLADILPNLPILNLVHVPMPVPGAFTSAYRLLI